VRRLADAARIDRFLTELGRAADRDGRCYLTGGTAAVLLGWRASTIDVDIRLEPETDALLRALQELKERLQINVELVSPADFVPVAPDWRERSTFVRREGRLDFLLFDFYAQALAKVERGHAQDLDDVRAMVDHGLVEPAEALAYFERIEPELFRFPALDPASFRRRVEEAFG
jgi:hypothetical protein